MGEAGTATIWGRVQTIFSNPCLLFVDAQMMLLLRDAFIYIQGAFTQGERPSHRDGFHTERLFDKGMLLDLQLLLHTDAFNT